MLSFPPYIVKDWDCFPGGRGALRKKVWFPPAPYPAQQKDLFTLIKTSSAKPVLLISFEGGGGGEGGGKGPGNGGKWKMEVCVAQKASFFQRKEWAQVGQIEKSLYVKETL